MRTSDQTQHAADTKGASHRRRFSLCRLVLAALLPVLFACLAVSRPAFAAEPCSNEQLRAESNVNPATHQPYSTQLPGCRSYELVSPADTGGYGFPTPEVGGGAGGPVVITPSGSVFSGSVATPAGTGAIEDGHFYGVFRSRRTPSGWATRDLTAFGSAGGTKTLDGVSADGSSILISTSLSLSPEDLNNPQENVTSGFDLYAVRETGPPEFVSHGDISNATQEEIGSAVGDVFPNADLSAIGFESEVPLSRAAGGVAKSCYIWRDSSAGARLAQLTNPEGPGSPPSQNCRYYAVAADGRPIVEDTSGDSESGLIFAIGSTISGRFPVADTLISGSTKSAAVFNALSADGETVYLTTTDKLVPSADTGADLYAVNLALTEAGGGNPPPQAPAVTCVSCEAAKTLKGEPIPNEGPVSWVGQSADGSHVFFRLENGDLYEHDSAGTRLVAPAADGLEHLVFSHNGTHMIALTSVSLSPKDENGVPDVYLFSDDAEPELVTNGTSTTASYTPVAVSDDGRHVVYEDTAGGAPRVIDEWVAGQTGQISPTGSAHEYSVLGTAGPELEDVFFKAYEPLVAQDLNAGTTDIYDARINGGFPAPSEPASNSQTPNPVVPTTPGYSGNLAPPSPLIAPLPSDTSHPASAAKPLTRAQKLAEALKACKKDKRRSTRLACEKSAHKKYGTTAKKSAHRKGRK